jgi:hypothetical protein
LKSRRKCRQEKHPSEQAGTNPAEDRRRDRLQVVAQVLHIELPSLNSCSVTRTHTRQHPAGEHDLDATTIASTEVKAFRRIPGDLARTAASRMRLSAPGQFSIVTTGGRRNRFTPGITVEPGIPNREDTWHGRYPAPAQRGGYQDDLIFVEDQKTLERELTARANAMRMNVR